MKRFSIVLLFLIFGALFIKCSAEPYYNHPTTNYALQRDFASYMDNVRSKLQKNWIPPDFLEKAHIKILFKIDKNGNVVSLNILESSGDKIYDEAAVETIKKSQPFGDFPQQCTREFLTINYSFDTTFVKTDKMREYYELSLKAFPNDKQSALNYINLAIEEVRGDEESYFLYKRRGKIKEALGDYVGARDDFQTYESMKAKVDIKRIHYVKREAEVEDSPYSYYYLAYAYEQVKDYKNAIDSIDKAIERTDLNMQYKRYRMELVRKAQATNTENKVLIFNQQDL